MDTAINGFHHVKLPVADLARSRDWYARVLGLQTRIEFAESGVLMGVAMRDADGTYRPGPAPRPGHARPPWPDSTRSPCASPHRLPWTRGSNAWRTSASRTAESSPGMSGRVLVGLHDPDGIEVRLYLPVEAEPEGEQR